MKGGMGRGLIRASIRSPYLFGGSTPMHGGADLSQTSCTCLALVIINFIKIVNHFMNKKYVDLNPL